MASTSTSSNSDPSLAELVRYSADALERKLAERRSPAPHPQTEHPVSVNWLNDGASDFAANPFHTDLSGINVAHNAAPLMPLRDRDLLVLRELFTHQQIREIEDDIMRNLSNRYPEPCWEDNLDFLKEYL